MRSSLLVVGVFAGLTLVGCGSPEMTETEKQAAYLDLMYADDAQWRSVPSSALLTSAQLVCQNLNLGEEKEKVIQLSIRGAFGPREATSLVENAIAIYCPNYDG